MAVPRNAVTTQRLMIPLVLALLLLAPSTARATDDDDDDDDTRTISIGDTVSGVFTSKTPTYHFRGDKDDIVTITLSGRTAEQIGVVMERSDKDLDFEWITGHYMDDLAASGNIRSGDSLRLTLRLPMTTKYAVFIRDASFNDEEAPYTLSVTSSSRGTGTGDGRVYVHGTIGAGLGAAGEDPLFATALNGTLAVGQRRWKETGLEGVLSATVVRADGASVMALLGIGIRAEFSTSPFRVRYAVGIAGMSGLTDHLGGGIRMDVGTSRFGFAFEAERLGRTNVFLALFGVAL